MSARGATLQGFLDALHAGLAEPAPPGTPAGDVVARIFAALASPGARGAVAPAVRPVTDWLGPALAGAGAAPPPVASHMRAIGALAPRLAWHPRPGAAAVGQRFLAGHANALVVGQGGLEERDDVRIGITLLAPDVVYPDHRHPPEEVYLVLAPGAWRQEDGPWHEPGIGGIVHNPPGIRHAMRSGAAPLLATWCLWTGATP